MSNIEANLEWEALLLKAVNEPGILSEAYQAFHTYSLGNCLLATAQCFRRELPLGPIDTFRGWKEKGRYVKKGQKGITLCMPINIKKNKDANSSDENKDVFFTKFVYRAFWFVLDQTAGNDYKNEIKIQHWDKNNALAQLEIKEIPFTHPDGNAQGYAKNRNIAVSPLAILPHKTRFHELAHVVLGHTVQSACDDTEQLEKSVKEVEAESVALLLCETLKLPGEKEARGYIQHWIDGNTIAEKSAQRIFMAANKILRSGQSPETVK